MKQGSWFAAGLALLCMALLAACDGSHTAAPSDPVSTPPPTRLPETPVTRPPTPPPQTRMPTPQPVRTLEELPPAPAATLAATSMPTTIPTAALTPARLPTTAPGRPERSAVDLPDDVTGFQVHLLYLLPQDTEDKELDSSGAIAGFAGAAQRWLMERTGGTKLRLDTYQGRPDVSFLRSQKPDAELGGSAELLGREVRSAGFDAANKIYAAFYGGTDGGRNICGVSTTVSIVFAGMFDQPQCRGLDPGLAMLHELLHAMGTVAQCAPNHSPASLTHVLDDREDLMFAGPDRPLVPTKLDSGRDDYFRHDDSSCLDVAESPFLDPTENRPFAYPGWPRFASPLGIGVDEGGNVYVADTFNHRVQVFTAQGAFVRSWGSEGDAQGQFRQARDVDAGPHGDVYIVDEVNHRVQRFTAEGAFLAAWGERGSGHGQFEGPAAVAVGAEGDVYVADTGNHRVQRFTAEGVFVAAWGGRGNAEGQLNNPQGIAVGPDGVVYVADTDNHRVQSFTPEGAPLVVVGMGELRFPFDVAVDADGLVYVAGGANGRVVQLSPDGELQAQWDGTASSERPFNRPVALAVAPDGSIFVADSGDNRVRVITRDR